MRRLLVLSLLASASLGDHLIEVSTTRYVGLPIDIVPIAVPDGYLPVIASQRGKQRSHWRSVSLGLANVDQAKYDGDVVGMSRLGSGTVMAIEHRDALRVVEIRYEEGRGRQIEHGSFDLRDFEKPRLVRVVSRPEGPVLLVAHGGGLVLAATRTGGTARVDRVPGAGDAVAATDLIVTGRDRRQSLFVVAPGRILHLVAGRGGFVLAAEHLFSEEGFVPHAIAAEGRELWVGGEAGGRMALLRFDAGELPGRAAGTVPVGYALYLGNGSATHLRFLGPAELAVGGPQEGRAWVGVVALGARPSLTHESFLAGKSIAALGVNPARKGWSIAATEPEGSFHLLRVPGDPGLSRGWDPFALPIPLPEPPAPEPPAPEEEPLPPIDVGTGSEAEFAILPRVEVDQRQAVDTEIVLIHLGETPQRIAVRLLADDGQLVSWIRVALEPGQRRKLSILDLLGRRRIFSFDGYARVDGAAEEDLILDAVIRREGEAAEEIRPRWR